MFGLLVNFGQLWGEPWYGKNTGFIEGLPTGLRDVELASAESSDFFGHAQRRFRFTVIVSIDPCCQLVRAQQAIGFRDRPLPNPYETPSCQETDSP